MHQSHEKSKALEICRKKGIKIFWRQCYLNRITNVSVIKCLSLTSLILYSLNSNSNHISSILLGKLSVLQVPLLLVLNLYPILLVLGFLKDFALTSCQLFFWIKTPNSISVTKFLCTMLQPSILFTLYFISWIFSHSTDSCFMWLVISPYPSQLILRVAKMLLILEGEVCLMPNLLVCCIFFIINHQFQIFKYPLYLRGDYIWISKREVTLGDMTDF